MITILDVISRTPEKINEIIINRKNIFDNFHKYIKEKEINEIVLVGSGSSYSTIMSTMLFIDSVSGIQTFAMLPNLFINKNNYNKNSLYVFVSQTGTSTLTNEAAKKLTNLGYNTVALTGDLNSPISKNCNCSIEIALGYEEYSYATLGFTCTMITEILFGLELGLLKNNINQEQYDEYINELILTSESNNNTKNKTLVWFENNKNQLLKADNYILFGGSSLFGIATEGALKIMEITKKFISIGFEMDDGLHGPNYCFDNRTIVLALNDGKDNDKAISLMNLMKKEYESGYMIGVNPMDEDDLSLDLKTKHFTNIEIISFVQTLAYKLAEEMNVDMFMRNDPRLQKTKGKGYFDMHNNGNKPIK